MKQYIYISLVLFLFSCSENKETADLILLNGDIYTMNEATPTAQAIAIKNGKITAIGTNEDITPLQSEQTQVIDLEGKFAAPGFIEGHGHFSNLGKSLMNLNFLESKSWDDIIAQVKQAVEKAPKGAWIEGGGWHQEKWNTTPEENFNGYPYHDVLSLASPDNPVVLYHASGHSLFANKAAMDIAGVSSETPNPMGGEIVKDFDKRIVGVFEERAMSTISAAYKSYLETLSEKDLEARWYKQIELAEQECLSNGITSFQDAGSRGYEVKRYAALAKEGKLDLRLWSMLRHPFDSLKNMNINEYRQEGTGDNFYTCRAIKSEIDGALGAFGAWLLRPYNDKPNFEGQNTTPIKDVEGIAAIALKNNMQLCVHAIGDRANRVTLNLMQKAFEDNQKNGQTQRWRIEHAQHLDTTDIPRFKDLGIIASMQGIHCTSDAPFVAKRLGAERSRLGAYPWRSLLDAGVTIANGTDAPVENVNPINSFYASVTRKRIDSGFEFYPEQRMTRHEALYSYTLGNAYAAFEEGIKGSLEIGKVADIVVLSENLITCPDEKIPTTQVLHTFVNGEEKYNYKNN